MASSQPSPSFSISALAIRNHIGTLMLTTMVIVVGVFFVLSLQVDLLPSITYPRIGVRIDAPGIAPLVAVEEITKPLEQALAATEGVTQIYSQTREGQVSLDLFFEPGGDIDQALNDTTALFNRVRNRLPADLETPRLFKFDPSQLPVYEFALTSPSLSSSQLRLFAEEELAKELGVLPGVAAVDVAGAALEEVQVNLDLPRLQSAGVGLNQVLEALEQRNLDVSGGRLLGQQSEPLTRTVGRFSSAQQIGELTLPLAGQPDQQLYLRDLAQIVDGTAAKRIFVSLNGKEAVKVSVQKQPDANTVEVVSGVKNRLAQLRSGVVIPQGTVITATLDESVFIHNAIANVTVAGLTGSLLAAIAVLLFLGSLRQTLIIVLAIPLATLTALILMKLLGLSLNLFSLGGLALGVGIVVDNSIVMLETIAVGVGGTPEGGSLPLTQGQIMQMTNARGQGVESSMLSSTSIN